MLLRFWILRKAQILPSRFFQTTFFARSSDDDLAEKSLIKEEQSKLQLDFDYFRTTSKQSRDKSSFTSALDLFVNRDIRRRGSVEFILAALKNMETFGVHRDLEVYKKVLDILPKGKYVPTNIVQADFGHYPKQQDCGIAILMAMDEHKVIPDMEMGKMLINIFGRNTRPFKRYLRMMYWLPKFKNLSPWPLPFDVSHESHLDLAKLAIQRITSVDRLTRISIYQAVEIEESIDKTWIVSGQSQEQQKLIENISKKDVLYVEGGFRLWLQKTQITYFILRAAPSHACILHASTKERMDIDDISQMRMWMVGDTGTGAGRALSVAEPGVHEQDDGTILACCATGTSSQDSLLSWIRFLQKENPAMENIPVMFVSKSPFGPVVQTNNDNLSKDLQ